MVAVNVIPHSRDGLAGRQGAPRFNGHGFYFRGVALAESRERAGGFPLSVNGEQNYLSVDDDPPLTIETDSSRHEVCFFDMAGVEVVTALRHACKAVTLTSRGRF